jgi:thiol-disulfide isomerase/thioredoxin
LLALPGSDEPAAKKAAEVSRRRQDEFHKLVVSLFENREKGGRLTWDDFAPRFMELAEEDPEDFAGYSSLEALALGDAFSPEATGDDDIPCLSKAIDLLIQCHARGNRLSGLAANLASPSHFGTASAPTVRFLREVLEKNPDADIRAEAAFSLVRFLKDKADLARRLEGEGGEALARRLETVRGRAYLDALRSSDPGRLDREVEDVSRQAVKDLSPYVKDHPFLPGCMAKEIAGEDVAGKPMSLGEFRGKVVVLSFWGFGCPPCRAMFPHEKAMVKRLEGRPFVLLGVDVDADRAKARERLAREGITWRSWWDGVDTGSPITEAWRVRSFPSVFMIDHKGVIRYRDVRGKDLELMVDLLVSDAEKDQGISGPAGTP